MSAAEREREALQEVYEILRAAGRRAIAAAAYQERENTAPATTPSGVFKSQGGIDGYSIDAPS